MMNTESSTSKLNADKRHPNDGTCLKGQVELQFSLELESKQLNGLISRPQQLLATLRLSIYVIGLLVRMTTWRTRVSD
jgi:hypothetical protein